MKLVSVGSSIGESNFHFVFTPKYRRDVFVDGKVNMPGELCRNVLQAWRENGSLRVRA
ncbi:MAG: hypothetical protein ACP5IE_05170 [Infirmifilum sp.]